LLLNQRAYNLPIAQSAGASVLLTAQSARIPIFCLKTCPSLFEIHTDSIRSTKLKVDRIASLWLNVACEFKRAGFLEGKAIGTSLPIELHRQP
jgi:hypothetical protein